MVVHQWTFEATRMAVDFNGEGEPSIERVASADVDIRPSKPLEWLWI
ncbi:hypothetical protein [Burkholderia ubonensis]|nr:hypothetical protein [Burkholderia ubonensis]